MKIVCINKNIYTIYLNKYYYQYNKDTISEVIKKILIILKKRYNLEIYSQIDIKCYINKYYGVILEIQRSFDPYSLYTKKSNIEMTCYYDSRFFYRINDYFTKDNINKCNIYLYENNYYIEIFDDEYLKIIEFIDEIIYGNKVKNIVNNSA